MRILLALTLSLLTLPSQAADAPQPADPAVAAKAPVTTPAPDAPATTAKAPDTKADTAKDPQKPEEPFRPSVQISEDLSVSFPADI